MAFCGLESINRDKLPKNWSNLQTAIDWYDTGMELTKWFWLYQTLGDVPFQYHKGLVDDVRKLTLSIGPSPLEDNAHRRITILAFVMPVTEENQLRDDQEVDNGATNDKIHTTILVICDFIVFPNHIYTLETTIC